MFDELQAARRIHALASKIRLVKDQSDADLTNLIEKLGQMILKDKLSAVNVQRALKGRL